MPAFRPTRIPSPPPPRRIILAAAGLAVGLAAVPGGGQQPAVAPPAAVTWSVADQGVRVEAELRPAQPSLADPLDLIIRVHAPWDLAVRPPAVGERLGDFRVLRWEQELPRREQDQLSFALRGVLEPLDIGPQQIPELRFQIQSTLPESNEVRVCHLPAQSIEVRTSLRPDQRGLDNLQPLAGPLEPRPPAPPRQRTWWLAGVAVATLVLAWTAWRFWPRSLALPPSPLEVAVGRLQQLQGDGCDPADGKRLLGGLTDVVRRYIEQTTPLRAAEQTTEEFLREAASRRVFSADQQHRLGRLLEQADLVKFAGRRASPADLAEMFRLAEQFLRESGETSSPAASPAADGSAS